MNSKLWASLALSGTLSLIAQNKVLAVSLEGESTLPFSANYDITTNFGSTGVPGIETISDSSSDIGDAPFGLTNFEALSYYNGNRELSSDPTAISGQGLPQGSVVFSGSGSNKLFATLSGSISFDDELLFAFRNGTLTFTGGEGEFSGATGTGSFESIVSGVLFTEPGLGDFTVYDASIVKPRPVPVRIQVGVLTEMEIGVE